MRHHVALLLRRLAARIDDRPVASSWIAISPFTGVNGTCNTTISAIYTPPPR